MNQSDPGCTNKIAKGYLRPHADVCARRCAIVCIHLRSASSRTGSDATAYTYVELPGSTPPPRALAALGREGFVEMPGGTHGETREMRDVSWECAHRHGLRLGHEAIVSMLTKGESNNEAIRQLGA